MIPSEISNGIPVGINKTVINAKKITSKVTRQENTVVFVDAVADLGVHIIEIGSVINIQ